MLDGVFIRRIVESVVALAQPDLQPAPAPNSAPPVVRIPRLLDTTTLAPVHISDIIGNSQSNPGAADFGILFLHGMADTNTCLAQNHATLEKICQLNLTSHSCVFGSLNLVHLIDVGQAALRQTTQYGQLAWPEVRNQILSAWPLTMGFYTDPHMRECIFNSIHRAIEMISARLPQTSKRLMVVGTDLGGTIAARFLGQCHPAVEPTHLVTFGCPFSWFEDTMTCPLPGSTVPCEWHNVFFKRDICSTPLATVLSARVTDLFSVIDYELEDDDYKWRPWQAWFSALNNLYLREDRAWEVVASVMHQCCHLDVQKHTQSTSVVVTRSLL